MTTAPLQLEAAHYGWQAMLTALFQMAFGLLLVFPLIRFKVLAPLGAAGRPVAGAGGRQARQPFSWRRRDELGALGRSFEHTRRSLQALFRDLEQRNSELRLREADLAQQTRVLRATLDNMTDGISLIDRRPSAGRLERPVRRDLRPAAGCGARGAADRAGSSGYGSSAAASRRPKRRA